MNEHGLPSDLRDGLRSRLGYGVAAAVAAGLLWITPLTSSLWLDETGTYYLVKDGLRTAFSRSLQLGGASPAYALIAWLMTKVGGRSELALRVPSFLAAILAAYLLFRLGLRLIGEEGAWIAVLTFISSSLVVFAADDARPFALALASLVGATLCLCRWVEGSKTRDAVGFVLLAGLSIYFHYIFSLAVAAQIPFATRGLSRGLSKRTITLSAISGVLVLVPAALQVVAIIHRRDAIGLPDSVTFGGLLLSIVPWVVIIGLPWGFLVAAAAGGFRYEKVRGHPWRWRLIGWWLLFPPVALFAAARVLGLKAFTARYFVMVVPALALAIGDLVRRVNPARARRAIAATLFLLAVVSSFSTKHLEPQFYGPLQMVGQHGGLEWNWRGTARVVNSLVGDRSTPVLIDSGFAETRSVKWLTDPEKSKGLLAPASFYPMTGLLIPVPSHVDLGTVAYMDALVRSHLAKAPNFILVTGDSHSPMRDWVEQHVDQGRFSARVVAGWGATWVIEFTRRS